MDQRVFVIKDILVYDVSMMLMNVCYQGIVHQVFVSIRSVIIIVTVRLVINSKFVQLHLPKIHRADSRSCIWWRAAVPYC